MKTQLFSLFLLIIVLVACKSKSEESTTSTEDNVVEIPEDFVPFYNRFHEDSLFQINHIVFPLKESSDSTNWERIDWQMHKPFNDMDGEFVRSFDNLNGIMVENIQEKNGFVNIERRFAKMGGDYNLIYYKITSQFDK